MKNLTLQGEICHIIPLQASSDDAQLGHIVAVIGNTTSADVNFTDQFVLDINDGDGDSEIVQRSNRPPVVFVVTSQGKVLALDENDRLVWVVDLEKVVLDSNEEDDMISDGERGQREGRIERRMGKTDGRAKLD